jgi:hypothetical protein
LTERKFLGLIMADVMRLAYRLAVRNENTGRKCLKNFLRRHKEISVRTPKGLSLSRARGFTVKSEGFHCQERGVSLSRARGFTVKGEGFHCQERGVSLSRARGFTPESVAQYF